MKTIEEAARRYVQAVRAHDAEWANFRNLGVAACVAYHQHIVKERKDALDELTRAVERVWGGPTEW